MKCNARIQLDKDGHAETYCQRKLDHPGDGPNGGHSITPDPFTPVPDGIQLVLPVALQPARAQSPIEPERDK